MGKKRRDGDNIDRALVFADNETTVYGQIISPLGQGQFKTSCSDGLIRTARVRGKDNKRVWIRPNDIVLLSIREGSPDRADIELRYMPKEVKILRDNNYIGDSFVNDDEGGLKIDFDQI